MHGSKIPIRTWVMVIFEMASNKNGTAAREVQRRYGLTAKSAWLLVHRIREAMKDDGLDLLGGEGHVIVAAVAGPPGSRVDGSDVRVVAMMLPFHERRSIPPGGIWSARPMNGNPPSRGVRARPAQDAQVLPWLAR
ncbi:hypothetical protein BH23ACT2_BH23ACT2_26420 [soil metagenome]